MRLAMSLLLLSLLGCDKKDPTREAPTDEPATDTDDTDDTDVPVGNVVSGPDAPVTLAVDQTTDFDATGLTTGQAYRVTLVHGDNLTRNADGTGVFVDNDANGAADAGPSEDVARITAVNFSNITAAKTFPVGTDNPASPTGIFPIGPDEDMIPIQVIGYGGGTVYPVVYTNAGASTFLEIDANGAPIEPYYVGNAITVNAPPPPPMGMQPLTPSTVAVGATVDYTIVGLDNTYAYRVTLVVDANITTDGLGGATFVDGDLNGAADAGASEAIALLTSYDTTPITPGAKTYPAGTDDPNAPTGIFPTAGEITVTVEGVAAGTIYPVAYRNAGLSTFLEIDPVTYAPLVTEPYTVGGSFTVQ